MIKVSRDIIRRPLITERATRLQEEQNRYVFKVRGDANKIEIKRAVEEIFEVKVTKVNTTAVKGKVKRLGRFQGRRANWKKAFVSVSPGQSIEFFEEV
jgi:large subunit ribosomal protein L23